MVERRTRDGMVVFRAWFASLSSGSVGLPMLLVSRQRNVAEREVDNS